jgi:hypothetical protein
MAVCKSGAEHEAVVPPFKPVQDHANGPAPETDDAVPAVQRLAVGALAMATPFALPQLPFVPPDDATVPIGVPAS